MKIAIYGRAVNPAIFSFVEKVFNLLTERGAEITIHHTLYSCLFPKGEKEYETFYSHEDIKEQVNFLLSIGGDGTLLDTLALIRDSGIPVAGINTGRLGFLATISKDEVEEAINNLFAGSYSLDKRSLLRLETSNNLFGDMNYALNEFTIHKKDSSSMVTVHTYLNGEYLNSYWADGLIISTPTGSTAYSLSCGGPIMVPRSDNFVITPIAPHNLNVRPIVVNNNSIIDLEMEGRSQQFLATLDSRSISTDASIKMTIKKENFNVSLLRLNTNNFLDTLRHKLMWGLDLRN